MVYIVAFSCEYYSSALLFFFFIFKLFLPSNSLEWYFLRFVKCEIFALVYIF